MKIVLSRKGFDSANGGIANPITPDGTMLSLPIPEKELDVDCTYDDLSYNGQSYSDIIKYLSPRKRLENLGPRCHLDPDLRGDNRVNAIDNWFPAFGQMGSAQGKLSNIGIQEGDLFLFFGWFQKTNIVNGKFKYAKKNKKDATQDYFDYSEMHAIFGYMQIGKILTNPCEISKYYWHPHASDSHLRGANNTLYLPAERLSFASDYPGCGTLKYDPIRVLTMKGMSKGIWNEYDFLMSDKILGENRKNSAFGRGLYYAGIWQEIVFEGNADIIDWSKRIITG